MKYKQVSLFILVHFFLVLFIVWSSLVHFKHLNSLDNAILNSVVNFRGEKGGFIYYLTRILTELGFVYVILLIIIAFLIKTKGDLKSMFLSLGVLTTYLVNMIVKIIITRQRPPLEFRWMSESSYSYPSSHTMCSTFFYGFIAYLIMRSSLKKSHKIILSTISVLIVLVVAFTRVILAVHYFSDVVGGFLFGISLLAASILLYEFMNQKGFKGLKKYLIKGD